MTTATATIAVPGLRPRGAAAALTRISLDQLAELPNGAAIEAVKRGLPSRLVRQLCDRLDVRLDTLTGPLQLTLRTLHRRMQNGTLAQPESERLLAIARVFSRAVYVLGDREKAAHWLKSHPPVFLGKTPLECMGTWLGIQEVEGVLWRIQDGVYS
jgi:putative toxin-antitoxin system antitoxin component (TIGR02293 family)